MRSNFLLNSNQIADVTGSIHYDVPAGGTIGSIATTALDTVNGVSQYSGSSAVSWKVDEAGYINASSAVTVGSDHLWNVVGDVIYGSNVYRFRATDSTAKFVGYGNGGYGGDLLVQVVRIDVCVCI